MYRISTDEGTWEKDTLDRCWISMIYISGTIVVETPFEVIQFEDYESLTEWVIQNT